MPGYLALAPVVPLYDSIFICQKGKALDHILLNILLLPIFSFM